MHTCTTNLRLVASTIGFRRAFHLLQMLKQGFGGVLEYIHGVSEKNCARLFLSELRQISINFNIFW